MLPKDYHPGDVINLPTEMGEADGFVPDASLRAQTQVRFIATFFLVASILRDQLPSSESALSMVITDAYISTGGSIRDALC